MATAALVIGIGSVWVVLLAPLAVIFGMKALRRIRRQPELAGRGRAITGVVLGCVTAIAVPLIVAFHVISTSRPAWTVAPPGAPYRYRAPGGYSATAPGGRGRYRSAITCNWLWTAFEGCTAEPIEVAVVSAPPAGEQFQPLLERQLKATKPSDETLTYQGVTLTPAGPAYRFNSNGVSGPGPEAGDADYWIPLPNRQAIRVSCVAVLASTTDPTCQLVLRTLHLTGSARSGTT
jgi:hypothetical protein